jgi:2,4-dienoyl-CoA reductase-like NADH-dependent reductase (Old Yellow Enzyme family)
MANLGFTQQSGNAILQEGTADLVSFGRPFIANPDLVERFEHHLPLSESNIDLTTPAAKMAIMIIHGRCRTVALHGRRSKVLN